MMGPLVLCLTLALLQVGQVFGKDNIPVIDDYSALNSRYLDEDILVGALIGTITAHDPDGTKILFELLGDGSAYFRINETTGVVFLKKKLDFDTPSERELHMTLEIIDEDLQKHFEELIVFVNDANDLPPEFAKYDIAKSLPEDTQPGYVVANIRVDDRDVTNDVLSVECEDDSEALRDACNKFAIQFNLADTGTNFWDGKLVLNQPLDYEQRNSYIIKLLAKDGVLTETNEVHIEVEDVNDIPPIWTRIKPVVVNEEEKPGTLVTIVTATDGDKTNPRIVCYELIEGFETFEIHNLTGVITNKVQIDFDTLDNTMGVSYDVKVKASEVITLDPLVKGNDPITTSTAVMTINIADIDDNPPTFNLPKYVAFIPENIVTGANVPGLQMTITDIDSGTFNSFDLFTTAHTDIFSIIPDNGKGNAGATLFIKNSSTIDYEKGLREYIIEVIARENKVPVPLQGSATVTVKVTDINDETPSFDFEDYSKTISETSIPGFVVIDLNAVDSEAGDFGEAGIRYEMFGNQQNHFQIDPISGIISVGPCNLPNVPGTFPCIDYQRKTQYILTVSATDNLGQPDTGRRRSVQVRIKITDENDNNPKPADKYLAFIFEEETEPVQPLIITAVDPDTVGGPVMYSLSGPPEVLALWQIKSSTDSNNNDVGIITARRKVLLSDAQDKTERSVNFQVVSRDIKHSVTSDVKIIIIDVNNNAPEFTDDNYEESIREDTIGERFIMTITATDADVFTEANGLIDFSIRSGARGKFSIKPRQEGANFLADIYTTTDATFNYDLQNRYEIKLVATDQGTPAPKSGMATLVINIIDINNKVPRITPTSVSIEVPEDERVNTQVHRVIAIDPDKTKQLRYYMEAKTAQNPTGSFVDKNVFNYEELFHIEEMTGIVRVNKGLNREVVFFMTNTLLVVDVGATPPQTGTGALTITILEVNDQDPEFDEQIYQLTIDEELNINYFVKTLHCDDDDDGIASYSLKQSAPRTPNYFSLEQTSGALIVANRIDFEKLEEIRMTATCHDDGSPRRSATSDIIITIRNINDNSPVFNELLYTAIISETQPGEDIGGRQIQVVSAADIDKGDFGIVRYKMLDNSDPFLIDELTGSITIKPGVTFDREKSSSYGFQVVAYDSPNTPDKRRETRVPVLLTIMDINDNCPVFSARIYAGSIPENANAGTDIIDVVATDRDFGVNKLLRYTVQPGSFEPESGAQYFDISAKSGRVFTQLGLSGKNGVYRFNVTATDTDGKDTLVMCSSNVPIEVTVSQSQNYAPNWIRPPKRDFVIYILESQYEGMLVYDSKAEDLDPGPSGIVDYFFVEGKDHVAATKEFRINQVTGVIRAEIEFDREDVDTYFLTLVAKDKGQTRATSETTLTVVIMDVDDNDPVFPLKDGRVDPLILPESVDLPEEQDIDADGKKIGQCQASDADSDHENNKIYYEILTADDRINQYIKVDRNTCEIKLTKKIDFEVMPVLEFSIYAFNEKNDDSVKRFKRNINRNILPVVVKITDVNDNSPEFTDPEYFACSPLDSPIQSSIIDLDAHDREQSDAELIYSLRNINSFTIDPQGIVRNSISFPSILARVFAFNAIVNDGTNSGSTRVNVFVTSEASQVVLEVNRPTSDVRRVVKEYQEFLVDSASTIKHACVEVRNHITDEGKISPSKSDLYISVVQSNPQGNGYQHWSASKLYSHITSLRSSSRAKMDAFFVTDVSKVDDDDLDLDEDVVLAILIVAILLIAFAIILFIVACYCIWSKKKKKTRKIKAQRHTVAQSVPDNQQESFSNPVYHNSGYVAYEDEYSTVNKSRSDAGPIAPVVIPAPENLQPLSSFGPSYLEPTEPIPPEVPEPTYDPEPEPISEDVIETEVLPYDEPEPPQDELMEPEYEHRIETTVEDDDVPFPDPPADDEIDTEIQDYSPPPSP